MSSEQSPVPDDAATGGPSSADGAVSASPGEAEIGEVEVEEVVDPATVRRAPRFGRFLGVGIALGLVLGLGVGGAWLQSDAAGGVFKPGVYFTVILVAGAALGAAVGGLWAVVADRRSMRGHR